jgi:hypothetical protein
MSGQSLQQRVEDALRDISVLAEGNVPGGVVPYNEVLPLIEDAVRYRYLRNQDGFPTPEEFDAMIDADMQLQPGDL